jgi:membrane protease YdiL (CAAX protease family)
MDDGTFGASPELRGGAKPSWSSFPGNLFLKQEGLRAGWRLLLYLGIVLVFLSGAVMLLREFVRPARGVFSPGVQLLGEFVSFLAVFCAALIMAQLEGRSAGVYGFPLRGAFGKLFWQGWLFGFVEVSSVVGLIAAFRGYSFGSLAESGAAMVRWTLFWALFFVVVAFFEEFFFRGYTLYTLTEGIGFWPAAVLLSLLFGVVHRTNEGENWVGIASVILSGLFWSFSLRRTGSLWFALGMHASFDFGETFLYSVPDSGMVFPGHLSNATLQGPQWLTGGTPGPEASVFDFLVLGLLFFLLHWMYPPKPKTEPTD